MPKPKVISVFKLDRFESRFLDIPMFAKPVDLFVECKSFDLEIPIRGKKRKELDIFEETILRMVDLKKCSVSELSDILCLKKDLVNLILIRLTEDGLLEDNQTLSAKGKEVINRQKQIRQEIEYLQAKLFVIKKTGLILPYIYTGEFQSERVEDFNSATLTIGFGSTGNYREIKGQYIRNSDFQRRSDSMLNATLVKKCIRKFNRLAAAKNMPVIQLSNEYPVSFSTGEDIYFHLQAVVQQGNVDELIFSDGFVSNIDGMMEYVRSENPDVFSNIKSRAANIILSGEADTERVYRSQKYSEIYEYYYNACKHLAGISSETVTLDEIKKKSEDKKQIVIDCYYMMEWGFYYYTRKNPLSKPLHELFEKRSASLNAVTLIQFARDIGFSYVDECKSLLSHLDGSKIHGVYEYQSPKLNICLPLAIAQAKEDSSSTIHQLVSQERRFLNWIRHLNLNSGLRHDAEAEVMNLDVELVLKKAKNILRILLPDLNFDDQTGVAQKDGDISNRRLQAQIFLEKQLGTVCFSSMTPGLQNEWIKISPDKRGLQLPNRREYIEILYRILQTELANANSELNGKDKLSKQEAIERLKTRCSQKLPQSFEKVKDWNYLQSTKGEKSTLGAEALVYMANIDDDTAVQLNQADYMAVLDQVISLRGHSELIALNETEESMNKLRDQVIQLTRIIEG